MLAYTDKGNGPVLVFVHGFCESKEIWDDFSIALSNTYRVICVDLPGSGQSVLPDETNSIPDYADQLQKTLQSLKITDFILIGHSLGGYISLAFAENYPYMLRGLVLFHSTAYADSEEKKNNRDRACQIIQEQGSNKFIRSMIPNLFSEEFKKTHASSIEHLIATAQKNNTQEGLIRAAQAMKKRKDRSEVLSLTDIPILFIIGKEDKAVPLEDSLAQCHLPMDSHVHLLAEVGHMGMLEAPSLTLKKLKNFVSYCE
ncbi:alpha/beta hydrolase [Algivirga pacifica]|uniref:Alpha/beta hydrolase n=1 Tax=Algivirga pacifica TaxID=1162670 RepID=A0ABP9DM80_9BACT